MSVYVRSMASDGFTRRASRLLTDLGLRHLKFQVDAAARCAKLARDGGRLLIEAPTGTGKTLIAHMTAALLAGSWKDEFRCLALVPSRPLLRQHIVEADWLLNRGVTAVNLLLPSDGLLMWEAVLGGPGLAYATPHSLRRRLAVPRILSALQRMKLILFDEIDVLLTLDSEERRDIWPTLDACLAADLPVVGFTGTSLTPRDHAEWARRGFESWRPDIPDGWLPFTRVRFVSVENESVVIEDRRIDEELRGAYREYASAGGNPRSWKEIKERAKSDDRLGALARRILGLHRDRLRLFEGEDDVSGKLRAVARIVKKHQPTLVLTRYVSSAEAVARSLAARRVPVVHAHGQMRATVAAAATHAFRTGRSSALVITRELGGRGLDFPQAATAILVSPRSNYRAVAQELARIRSREENPKEVTILYYAGSSETAKAARLAQHLVRDNQFAGRKLFETIDVPKPAWELDPLELAHMPLEEELELSPSSRVGRQPVSSGIPMITEPVGRATRHL